MSETQKYVFSTDYAALVEEAEKRDVICEIDIPLSDSEVMRRPVMTHRREPDDCRWEVTTQGVCYISERTAAKFIAACEKAKLQWLKLWEG